MKNRLPPFVAMTQALLKDPEFRKLSNSAKVLYMYLRSKFNCVTFSEVTLSYGEIEDMMSAKTISRAFKDLQEAKFIVKTKHGGLYGGVCAYKFIGVHKDFYYKGHRI